MKDQNIPFFYAVEDDILAHGEATQTGTQTLVAAAADMWVASQKIETRGDRIDEPVGNVDATALFCNLTPDVEEFGFRFW
jgi:hypothetical protein